MDGVKTMLDFLAALWMGLGALIGIFSVGALIMLVIAMAVEAIKAGFGKKEDPKC